ncbi:UNVERIFIED_CONTAM: hypothetical protein H355_015395 [Colinus virginianus]|nr:hypothetical protein H355_015395 [Colinus virginianus]
MRCGATVPSKYASEFAAFTVSQTTFIQHLLEKDYPGLRIGPEPTTDRFVAVMENDTEQIVPGNAAVVDPTKPFSQLSNFGNNFLLRFECALLPCVVLNGVTLIDTPGVLSGNKQTSRGYDFEGVIQWFAERVDLILLIFDAHKLDISDEFRRCINVRREECSLSVLQNRAVNTRLLDRLRVFGLQALRGNDTKIRIILNKADMVSYQQLMRVYGALMWSLGKANDLYADIARLPRDAAIRKINDFIKRARLAKVHAYLLATLRKQIPMWGKDAKKKQLISQLQQVYQQVAADHAISLGDFPPLSLMQEKLAAFDWNKIPKLDPKRIEALDAMIKQQIPQLMALIPAEEVSS